MALWFLFYFFSLLSHPSVESLYLTTPLAVGFLIHQVFIDWRGISAFAFSLYGLRVFFHPSKELCTTRWFQ